MRVARIAQTAMKRSGLRNLLRKRTWRCCSHPWWTCTNLSYTVTGSMYQPEIPMRQQPSSTREPASLFSNLLLNAVDAMPEGGTLYAKISKTREWRGQERGGLRITIADTGIGIPAEILSRIREPYFTTKGASGNGMGLAVVYEIVTQHDGHMKIRSSTKEGKSGSVFSIFIPETARA